MNTHSNKRILVIDDNHAIHEDLRKILTRTDANTALEEAEAMLFEDTRRITRRRISFEVDSAFQGQEGYEKVRESIENGRPYAMAYVDVRMPPGWDGIETISRIWEVYPDLQIVLCTAYADYSWEEIVAALKQPDSVVILKKPFDNIEVLQLAHALTCKWHLTQQARGQLQDLEGAVRERTRALQAANDQLTQQIQERLQAEVALHCSEERFARAFDASPFPMAILDLRTRKWVDVNGSFLQVTGHQREDVVGHTPDEVQLWANSTSAARILEIVAQGQAVRNLECQVQTCHGQTRETLLSTEAFSLGEERHLLFILQDISEMLSLENQLRQVQKMEAVGQLAAGIAHDFNNLLTVVQGHTSLRLATPGLDPEMEESLQSIQGAADRASTLTRQLLSFARKQIMQPKALDLNHLLDQLVQMLERLIGEHIRLTHDFDATLPAVFADGGKLEQVIMNLVVNARDAMPEGGEIHLSTSLVEVSTQDLAGHAGEARPGKFVRLRVRDSGCGMGPSVLEHLFEPFFTTKPVGKGTGMGLATVYGIVNQHHGWIKVDSQVGQGTTFSIYLPPHHQPAEVIQEVSSTPTARRGDETVLLVEDEPVLRELIQDVLEAQGYHVLVAASGAEALQVWKDYSGKIDLLLTDMVMPGGMNGQQLAAELVPRDPRLKVIITSGYSQEMVGRNLTLPEGADFLPKPYRPPELVEKVRNVLDGLSPGEESLTTTATQVLTAA
jgi:PAS domain S-box-containing protein